MQPARKVFFFVIISVLLFLIVSIIAIQYGFTFQSFNNVNLLSDVVSTSANKDQSASADSTIKKPVKDSTTKDVSYSFENYKFPGYITAFKTDTLASSLSRLDAKLLALKQGKKVKIRIAYLGDSMIEGDLLTQTLRKLFQQQFGGNGVGFVPVIYKVGKFRTTVSDDYSGEWQDDNFKTATAAAKQTLFLSGHTYRSNKAFVTITDRTINDSVLLEKNILCGKSAGSVIQYNNQPITINATDNFNRILLSTDYSHSIKLDINDSNLPMYGVSFESPSGVFVDNFSFRGISGFELNGIDTSFLKTIDQNNPYDVIILGYGVNVLYRPNDLNFEWYRKLIGPVIKKFSQSFPKSDIIIVSTADRAFRYNGEYKTAVGIDSLIKIQAALAFDNHLCFYNQFATMGGANTIVKWANKTPAFANKDYIHPNLLGSEILAGHFFNAVLNDYNKYLAALNTSNKTN